MKVPTTKLAVGGFVGFMSIFRRQRSIGLRSIHAVPAAGCGRPSEQPSDSPATAAPAKDPSWVLLDCTDCRWDGSLSAADGKTVAECGTGTGQRLRVSFGLSAPPAKSFLSYNFAGTAPDDENNSLRLKVAAAHGDSVLLRMRQPPGEGLWSTPPVFDEFVYRAGGAARPPSLSLLPPRDVATWHEIHDEDAQERDPYLRAVAYEDSGVLRRGEDDLLVVQLELTPCYRERYGTANLSVLHLGRSTSSVQWEHKLWVPIVHDEGDELPTLSGPETTIPVGDRFLCWVCHIHGGFVLCDMAEEASPKLQYIRQPYEFDPEYYTDDLRPLPDAENMGVVAGAGAVRFVAVRPRCCCGGYGRSSCPRSQSAFTVTTWTMTLTMDDTPMTWVKDGVMDCEELWGLPGYEGILPRVIPRQPILSLENPDHVYFKVLCNTGKKAWTIQVDLRRKELLSAVRCSSKNPWKWETYRYLPAKLQ